MYVAYLLCSIVVLAVVRKLCFTNIWSACCIGEIQNGKNKYNSIRLRWNGWSGASWRSGLLVPLFGSWASWFYSSYTTLWPFGKGISRKTVIQRRVEDGKLFAIWLTVDSFFLFYIPHYNVARVGLLQIILGRETARWGCKHSQLILDEWPIPSITVNVNAHSNFVYSVSTNK